jgi:hypothetical protein
MSYEHKDASLKVIGVSAGLLALMVAASIGTSFAVYDARYHGTDAVPTAGRTTSFKNGAGEQIGILVDYGQVVRAADERLNGYAWVDRNAGIARIPIDRAMELIASGAKPAPAPKEPGQVP